MAAADNKSQAHYYKQYKESDMTTAAYSKTSQSIEPQQHDDNEVSCTNNNNTNHDSLEKMPTTNHHHSQQRHELFKTLAGVAGNVLEWYDFAVFGYFGDIISEVFFPPQSGNRALVESFAIFGGAFLMRPVGGILLGYIGDYYGRKRALEISIFLMAVPTFCMGCLPSFEQVGWASPILLTIVRLLQGLSVGGQLMSSLVFTLEGHSQAKWGLYGSYVMASANLGTLLGGLMGFVLKTNLNPNQLQTWGWRIPFLSGILVSFSGLYLKCYCKEDEIHIHHSSSDGNNNTNPIRQAFAKSNQQSLVAASLVPMLWSAGFYLCFVWMAIFMDDLIDPSVPGAFAVNSASLFVSVCLFFPVAGYLSDQYGRTRVMTCGGIAMALLSPPLVVVIGLGNAWGAYWAQSTLGIALSFWGAPMCAWLVEAFEPQARLTSVAIGYNLAQALVGGSTPALATIMVDGIGVNSPGLLLTGLAILSLIGLKCVAPPPPPPPLVGGNHGRRHHGVIVADGYAPPTQDEEEEEDHVEMMMSTNSTPSSRKQEQKDMLENREIT